MQYFTDNFSKLRSEIEGNLGDYTAELHGDAGQYFNNLLLEVQKLQKFLTDSTHFLSAYEVQKAQIAVNKLKQAVEQKKNELAPKKKFAFKADKKKISPQVSKLSLEMAMTYQLYHYRKSLLNMVLCHDGLMYDNLPVNQFAYLNVWKVVS